MQTIFGVVSFKTHDSTESIGRHLVQADKFWTPNRSFASQANHYFVGGHAYHEETIRNDEYQDHFISLSDQGFILADIRLDNKSELILDLALSGNSTKMEILASLWKVYGTDMFTKIKGAFAIVIYQGIERTTYFGADKLGEKTLYYYLDAEQLIFSTYSKPINTIQHIDRNIDWEYIVRHQRNSLDVSDRTSNAKIKLCLPSYFYSCSGSNLSQTRYWRLDLTRETVYTNPDDYVDHFLDLFRKAIENRMRGYRNVGCHLSGGLDSSGVTANAQIIAQRTGQKLSSFSYIFDKTTFDKAKRLGYYNFNNLVNKQIDHSKIENPILISKTGSRDYKKILLEEVWTNGGLSWSNNVITEREIVQEAKKRQIGVILSGFPGDELVTSFCRAYYLEYLERGQLWKFFSSRHKDKWIPHYMFVLLLLKYAKKLGLNINSKRLGKILEYRKRKVFNTAKRTGSYGLYASDFIESNSSLLEALASADYVDIHHEIPLSLKAYQRNHIERSWTMRRILSERLYAQYHHVSYQHPMADADLIEYVLSIPVEQKRSDNLSRSLYRKAMRGLVVDEIRMGDKFSSILKPALLANESSANTKSTFLSYMEHLQSTGLLKYTKPDSLKKSMQKRGGRAFSMVYKELIPAVLVDQGMATY